MSKQYVLYLALALYLATLWTVLVLQKDQWLSASAIALLASPVLLFVLRVWFEDGYRSALFSYKTQSWAFLFGDLALAVALGAAASGRRSVPDDSWFRSVSFLALCIAIGVVGGVAFHFGMEVKAYTDDGHASALLSPTKLAHDFVSYPLLLGALVYLGLPVLVHQFRWVGALVLVGVAVWIAMVAIDAVHPPKPANMHPDWDPESFSVVRK